MAHGRPWTEVELLAAFALYCRTPFGKLHAKNPDIIEYAKLMGRTAGALAMKLVNLAHLDPVQQARGVAGLGNVSQSDIEMWNRFARDPDGTALAAENATASIGAPEFAPMESEGLIAAGQTEATAIIRIRLVQGFFRRTVLASYDYMCAICELPVQSLLCASHIIPWSQATTRRADPTNGLSLCALHDRAFDRGYISLDDDRRLLVASDLRAIDAPPPLMTLGLLGIEGQSIRSPTRFSPDINAIRFHRANIYKS